jgi:hypothetical protein
MVDWEDRESRNGCSPGMVGWEDKVGKDWLVGRIGLLSN